MMDTNSSIEGYLFCIAPVRQGGGGSQFIQTFCVLSGRQFSQWRHKGDLVRKSPLFFFFFLLVLSFPPPPLKFVGEICSMHEVFCIWTRRMATEYNNNP